MGMPKRRVKKSPRIRNLIPSLRKLKALAKMEAEWFKNAKFFTKKGRIGIKE